MELYEDFCCTPMPAAPIDVAPPAYEPAPVAPTPAPVVPEPAPVLTFEPPAPPAPVAYDPPAPAPAPAPVPAPVSAPVDAGSLLGPSTIGGTPLTFGGPDLGGSHVGGSASLGMTWTDSAGNPTAAPEVPVAPGPFSGAAATMHATANASLAGGILRDGTDSHPAPWTPGYDSDRDRIPNESDNNPANGWAR